MAANISLSCKEETGVEDSGSNPALYQIKLKNIDYFPTKVASY